MLQYDMAFWEWKPNPLFTIKRFFQRNPTTSGSFSAGSFFITLQASGPSASSRTDVPTTLEALNDIEKVVQKARHQLLEEGAARLLKILEPKKTMLNAELKKAASADDWFERFPAGVWPIVEHLKGNGKVTTFWSEGPDKLPDLNVKVEDQV